MAFREDVATKILVGGLATGLGTDLFLGSGAIIPKGSGPYITLTESGGTARLRSHSSAYPRPSLQIVVRAQEASVARNKAVAIHAAVGELFNTTLGDTFYLSVTAVQEVMDMQKDESGRARFGFNLTCVSR